MRIAMIAPLEESVPPKLYGGTERVIDGLCRGLRDAGVHVTLFATGDSAAPSGELVPVVPEAMRLKRGKILEPHYYHFKMLAEVASRAREFDVIHNHHDAWMLPLSEMVETPVLSTMHLRLDSVEARELFPRYPRSYYVSISDSQRRPLPELNWMKTIYHGLDLAKLRFCPTPGNYLAFLGRMDPTKGAHLAIEIAKRSGVPLKLAAKIEAGAMQGYYDALIKPHVDGQFIEYVGEINESEKSKFLGEALALVFPIDWPEPFGLAMVEALACGTPVLARPYGSVPEILRDGLTGFIHADPVRLAQRVSELPSISRFACRRWVEQRFSLERMTEEYIDVYRQLVELTRARNAGTLGIRPSPASASSAPAGTRGYRRDLIYPVQRPADGNS